MITMGRISVNDVRAILDAIEEEELLYFRIKTATLDISLAADTGSVSEEPPPRALGLGSTVPTGEEWPGALDRRPVGDTASSRQREDSASHAERYAEGVTAIVAPTLGLFYAAPTPGAPAFVEVGSMVTPSTTVGLIEAMKVFTAVPAGVDGVIVGIQVKSGDVVEFGTTLMLVEPRALRGGGSQVPAVEAVEDPGGGAAGRHPPQGVA